MCGVYYVGRFINGKIISEILWYHMRLKESRTLHAFCNWWVESYLIMWIGVYVHWWTLLMVMNTWTRL